MSAHLSLTPHDDALHAHEHHHHEASDSAPAPIADDDHHEEEGRHSRRDHELTLLVFKTASPIAPPPVICLGLAAPPSPKRELRVQEHELPPPIPPASKPPDPRAPPLA